MITALIVLVLVGLNGFFVAAEFGIVGSPRAALLQHSKEGSKGAKRVLRILDDPKLQDRYIATAQLGITLASLGLGMYGEHALAEWLAPHLEGLHVDRWVAAHTLATIASVTILSYLHIVLGEMVPKSLALHQPEKTAIWITPGMRMVELAMYPLVVTLNGIGNGVLRLMGIDRNAVTAERFRTPQEIAYEVRESEKGGLLPADSADVMQELLEFTDLLARGVMIPRVMVKGIPSNASQEQMREILERSPHTRYPVFEGSLDAIVGVIHVKDILRAVRAGQPISPETIRPATFVAESVSVDDVLRTMQRAHTQMAIVMDEHGGTAGLLTIEDLFEEVVGEIGEDECSQSGVARDDEGSLRVRGTVRIIEVGEALAMAFDHPRVDTVSGLVLTCLGRPAVVGDRVEYRGVTLEVTRTRGRGVAECIVTPPAKVQQVEGAGSADGDGQHVGAAGARGAIATDGAHAENGAHVAASNGRARGDGRRPATSAETLNAAVRVEGSNDVLEREGAEDDSVDHAERR